MKQREPSNVLLTVIGSSPIAKDPAATSGFTLNGYSFAEAEQMVRTFQRNPVSLDDHTSVWFDKQFIYDLHEKLPNEFINGFRFYFAAKDGHNALIMVATQESNDVNDEGKHYPIDHFKLMDPYFRSNNKNRGDISVNKPLVGISNAGSDCTSATPCNKSPKAITCDNGRKWVNAFGRGKIKTRSLWYPKSLIDFWKTELEAAESKGADGDGIRVYFAKKSKHVHVFVSVTTRIVEGDARRDYYKCYSDDKESFIGVDDNGEECPNSCQGATWDEDPELPMVC